MLPIGDYALISNCNGSALVGRNGSIDWACLPHFDSPSIFARLLDERAGYWRIAPADAAARTSRAYIDATMVLRTTFRTNTGAATVTDALALAAKEAGHQIGRHAPPVILRVVEAIDGYIDMTFELVPRTEYGLTVPLFVRDGESFRSRGGPVSLRISSDDLALHAAGGALTASFRVSSGQRMTFALEAITPWRDDRMEWNAADAAATVEATCAGWRSWSALHQSYDGPYAPLVAHSGRVLQALTYAPTGAIVAAPTTSLPEQPGGARNWDYRYCWVRDASLTLSALWVAACPDEAREFFDFLATAAGGRQMGATPMQIMYGVTGERLIPEHSLEHLDGYAHSRPVRIGNGAWNQKQLDVYGELMRALKLLAPQVGELDPVTASCFVDVADTAAARWQERDQGIWEVRGEPRHFLNSKLMCWSALDCAIALAAALHAEHRVDEWSRIRDEIRDAIETRGWSETARAFAQSFDHDELDASALRMPLVGFLPATDPRMRATIEAITERLTDSRGFVFRYRSDDGLQGGEGTFAICTFWLVQCLAKLGELERARELFEKLTSFANDVGLMSEEIDAESGALLGNFPQAFTHIGLVNAAWAIAQAEAQEKPAGIV